MIELHKDIEMISHNKISVNNFNPNEVSAEEQQRIVDDIKTNGFFGGILVRPTGDGLFEIVDGEHRYRALIELGADLIPCIVREHSDTEAKINCIRLNTERGTQNPQKIGKIAIDLAEQGVETSALSDVLVYSPEMIEDMKVLAQLPDDTEALLQEMEQKEREETFVVWSFLVPSRYSEEVKAALEKMADNRGEAFGEMCRRINEDARVRSEDTASVV